MFRSWRVEDNLKLLSKETNIVYTELKNIWFYNSYLCAIIDSNTTICYQELIDKIINKISKYSSKYIIILANMDKKPLPDINKIINSFPDDTKPCIKIFNHNLKTDVYRLMEELYNKVIQHNDYYGVIKNKFSCYLAYNTYEKLDPGSFGEFTPKITSSSLLTIDLCLN